MCNHRVSHGVCNLSPVPDRDTACQAKRKVGHRVVACNATHTQTHARCDITNYGTNGMACFPVHTSQLVGLVHNNHTAGVST